jgi:hypothetical protein
MEHRFSAGQTVHDGLICPYGDVAFIQGDNEAPQATSIMDENGHPANDLPRRIFDFVWVDSCFACRVGIVERTGAFHFTEFSASAFFYARCKTIAYENNSYFVGK